MFQQALKHLQVIIFTNIFENTDFGPTYKILILGGTGPFEQIFQKNISLISRRQEHVASNET